MRLARSVERVFFPLDEELGLLPGVLTPALQETLVRLGARMPFRSVVQELAFLKHVTTTEATVRRHTETAGTTYVALQTAEAERVERTLPTVTMGAPRQLLSADGAMVPLVHGTWAEVKTVALGTIQPPVLEQGEAVVHKRYASPFFGTPLMTFFNSMGCDTLIVSGFVTSGCVRAFVVDAASYNFNVIVAEDGVADRFDFAHRLSLIDMDLKYADVVSTEEIIRHIDSL